MMKKGLYLAGGGARGAYQAGVLKGIYTILKTPHIPFDIVTGVSVGSANACILAQHADHFHEAVAQMEDLWCHVQPSNIYNANHFDITKSLIRNLGLIFLARRKSGYFLDTEPLHGFLKEQLNFKKISKNIQKQSLKMLEIICTCYDTQQNFSFCQENDPDFTHWQHYKHISSTTDINLEHVLASGALPLFFSPIKIEQRHYGDGSMGLISPLRGIVHSKADKVLIISNRHPINVAEKRILPEIGFAQVLGSMLNGLFQDNLDRDIEVINHVNEITQMVSIWNKHKSLKKEVQTMHLRPNIDLSKIALKNQAYLPGGLKTLFNFFGGNTTSGDLMSFLLFQSNFTSELFHLGFDDTLENSEDIVAFFKDT